VTEQIRLIASVLAVLAAGAASATAQQVRYYHLDAVGSVRALTNAQGTILERHDYLPFGEECTSGCESNPGLNAGGPRKFTGKERDKETGFDYFGARYYGSKVARFTTVDPVYTWRENILDPQRWNRYAYVRNNPLRYVDPDGRELRTTAQETINAIAGDAAGRVTIRNGVVDTSGLTAADLSGNEGALLLNQLATSQSVYSYTEASNPKGVTNLDTKPDWRYGKGKGPGDLPPAGVDAAVTVDPSVTYVDAASGTKKVSRPATAFHELAEAYGKVDKGMPYVQKGGGAGAHEDARQRERTLIGQRPGFTEFPAGEVLKKQNP
jgi:RHS repeat-associated protein